MKTEYDINQTVWSLRDKEWVTIARISIDTNGITYEDLDGNHHKPTELSAEFTREQFMEVLNTTLQFEFDGILLVEDIWEVVQECIKVAQK